MKRLKPSLALILIALALVLTAGSADVPKLSPSLATESRESIKLAEQLTAEHITPGLQSNLSHAIDRDRRAASQQNDGHDYSTAVIAIFTVISAIAAALIAWFNFQLVGVTDEMKKATAKAAEAAAKSAELAARALHLDRPFLHFDSIDLKNFHPDSRRLAAVFTFKNRGKSVAFISDVQAALGITNMISDLPYIAGGSPPTHDFPGEIDYSGDYSFVRIETKVLEPGQSSSQCHVPFSPPESKELDEDRTPMPVWPGHLSAELFRRLTTDAFDSGEAELPEAQLTLRGIVRYRDAAQEPFWTEFCWDYVVSFDRGRDLEPGRFVLRYYKDGE
ncbi:MAG TPA: hypothetical protein VED84_01490 [Acidimicrobiales bacterium]|nr:hypothetical protein [Acidimicrobiales bacterium]HYB91744.1 hypothetical protein [Candidatus Binataceae bacterium]